MEIRQKRQIYLYFLISLTFYYQKASSVFWAPRFDLDNKAKKMKLVCVCEWSLKNRVSIGLMACATLS